MRDNSEQDGSRHEKRRRRHSEQERMSRKEMAHPRDRGETEEETNLPRAGRQRK